MKNAKTEVYFVEWKLGQNLFVVDVVVAIIVVDSLQYGITVISLYAFALTDIYDAQRYILLNWFRAQFFPLPFRFFHERCFQCYFQAHGMATNGSDRAHVCFCVCVFDVDCHLICFQCQLYHFWFDIINQNLPTCSNHCFENQLLPTSINSKDIDTLVLSMRKDAVCLWTMRKIILPNCTTQTLCSIFGCRSFIHPFSHLFIHAKLPFS